MKFRPEINFENKLEKGEEFASVTHFDLARHSIKESNTQSHDINITEEGVQEAISAGLKSPLQPEFTKQSKKSNSVEVQGSPRERTVQSSVFRALAEQFKDVTFDSATCQEVIDWLREGGLEDKRTELLNFGEGNEAYAEKYYPAYKKGELFKWIAQESDQASIETKQNPDNVFNYSMLAGNVATYLLNEGLTYKEPGKVIFGTTHQTILESFLHKALIKLGEDEKAAEFLEKYQAGFAENQGYQVDFKLRNIEGEDFEVVINFEGEEFTLSKAQLMEIIGEGSELYKQLAANVTAK